MIVKVFVYWCKISGLLRPVTSYLTCLVLLMFMVVGKCSYAETFFPSTHHDTDSLKRLLETTSGGERVNILCLLASEYKIDSVGVSLKYAEEAYQLARSLADPKLELLATYTLSSTHHHSGNYPKAVSYGFDAKAMAEAQYDTASFYGVMECIILSYIYSNNYDLAISNTHSAFEYIRNWTDPEQLFEKHIRIGWVYMMTGNFRQAVPYFLEAEKDAEASQFITAPKKALNATHLSRCYLRLEKYDSARISIAKVEKICQDNGLEFADFSLGNLGTYYFRINRLDSAMACYRMILEGSMREGDMLNQASSLSRIAELHWLQGQSDSAISNFHESIEKAEWVRDHKSYFLDRKKTFDTWYTPQQSVPDYLEILGLQQIMQSQWRLYEIHKTRGDHRDALEHLEAYNEAVARSTELNKKREVTEINTRYETERKEQQILLLTSENELSSLKLEQTRYFLFALFGFILLILLVAILIFRQNKMKALQDKTILEQRLLRAQMNPHFLFNTLANIQGYMMENDMDKASHYLSRFSRLMRNILDNTAQEFITLDDEISTIENYLELQRVRFPGKFEYLLEVDEALDPEVTLLPPMLAQPFIENSVEHGIRHLKAKGQITVRYTTEGPLHAGAVNGTATDALIHIEVIDNGIGRVAAKQIESELVRKHRPMATAITLERLNVLGQKAGRKLRKKVKMEIEDLADEHGNALGTRVGIWAPSSSR